MGMLDHTILYMTIPMNTRRAPSTPRRPGRSIFGVDGVATTTGTVTSTGMAVDMADMAAVGMADIVVVDTGDIAKASAATLSLDFETNVASSSAWGPDVLAQSR
jgi:hypothetical protein